MKNLTLCVFALMLIAVAAVPAKDNSAAKPKCNKACPFDYDPVCGGQKDSKEKPLSFGNECVLKTYNCENNKQLTILSKGECPGSTGVRLQ